MVALSTIPIFFASAKPFAISKYVSMPVFVPRPRFIKYLRKRSLFIIFSIFTITTFEDFAIASAKVKIPITLLSCSLRILSATLIEPSETSLVFSLITFVSSPIATVIGLNIEPGSK